MAQSKTNSKPSGQVTIAFLKCDKVPEEAKEAHGEYQDVLHNLFEPLIPEDSKLELETLSYDVVHKREYPKDDVLARTDAIVVSGSFEDEAHADTMWILKLAGFLIKVHDEYPKTRIVGICFGLQVIARAFGPSTIKENPKGWEVGSTRVDLTETGRKLIWGEGDIDLEDKATGLPDHVMMQQIHSDCVFDVPPSFHLIGSSEKTPVQGIVHFYPDPDPEEEEKAKAGSKTPEEQEEAESSEKKEAGKKIETGEAPEFTHSHDHELPKGLWRKVHIIAFQDILIPLIDNYEKDGTYSKDFAEEARKNAKAHHDGKQVGKILLRVLGVATE
ncbi:hypothetical protein QFC24_001247 [Naganishia onofrii]|uniref:Uncharacterized protein n=1 Tax=Naganishia onofrii TaxID=1851511 RepID=A0ACC2XVJ1_9TREE|nr:hypothetical protein QFC24_001247 [Naganishia onofrii]